MRYLIFGLALLALASCKNTINYPEIVMPSIPAYEGNEANSGVYYQISTGGFIISEKLRAKHDAYMKKYYKHLNLESPDYSTGVIKCNIVTDEYMSRLLKMHTWEKNPWLLEDSSK